jgi:predicted transposase YbfD/YdcC
VRRRRRLNARNKRKWSAETVYAVTSLTPAQASPAQLAAILRGHWSIEDSLHWVRSPGTDLVVASCGASATRVSFSF